MKLSLAPYHKAFCSFILSVLGLCWGASSYAQFNVGEIVVDAQSQEIPVATANFAGESVAPESISAIIRADLGRTGRLRNLDMTGVVVSEMQAPEYSKWSSQGAAAFVAGSLNPLGNGQYEVRFRLYDVKKQKSLGGLSFTIFPRQVRATAHRIADYIYEKLLGERGVFATRLSYVAHAQGEYKLLISDSDGLNAQAALTSREPIISPSWSPDGSKVAYVSFEDKKPIVYVHDVSTGQRTLVANQKGNNSAPAWSPDGQRLALALSKDGNTQVYVAQADGSGLKRFSQSDSIDTEPQFSPDGKWIYFTSDRGGSPQIYRMSAQAGENVDAAKRITFKGNYNTSPRISPDGNLLAYISQMGGGYRLHTFNLQTNEIIGLTDTAHDETPTFAANGKYIIYATRFGNKNVLAAVSIDGRMHQVLSLSASNAKEPSWGPFMK